ncbi:hypothetical protein JCM17960_16750 [Magnetospira thiophila]
MHHQHQKRRALRLAEVLHLTGISRAQVYRMVASGAFPAPYKLSETGRITAWKEAEVQAWLAEKFEGRDQ